MCLLCRLREAQLCHLLHWNYSCLLCRLREAQHIQYKSSHCLLPCQMTPLFERSFLAVQISVTSLCSCWMACYGRPVVPVQLMSLLIYVFFPCDVGTTYKLHSLANCLRQFLNVQYRQKYLLFVSKYSQCSPAKTRTSFPVSSFPQIRRNLTIICGMQYLQWGKLKHDKLCDIWLLGLLWLLATTLRSVASETSRPVSTFLEQLLLGDRKWGRWIMSHHIL